nr:tetratricopeptide repeat protein [uncultured Desulfobacter sp.]
MSDPGSENSSAKEIRLIIRPEDAELVAVRVRDALAPDPVPPAGMLSRLKTVHTAVTGYWIWISLIFFILAWVFLGASPLYPVKKWAAASRELDAKLAQFEFQEELSRRYLTLGNSFLDSGHLKDAKCAFDQALKMNPNSREAEYGIMKSCLLTDSAAGQLDPEVMGRRIALLEESDPPKKDGDKDAHVAYAKARLLRLQGEKSNVIRPLLERAVKSRPSFAAAYGELGLLALEQNDKVSAIDAFTKGHTLAPHDPFYMGLLGHTHGKKGDTKTALEWVTKAYRQDPEIFTGFLERARVNLIYAGKFKWVAGACKGLPERYEAAGLSQKDKNTTGYSVRYKGRSHDIASWNAKKAYCAQLGLLAAYFRDGPGNDTALIEQQLEQIWDTALEGRHALPIFLIHDLEEMEGCNAPGFQKFKSDIRRLKAFAAGLQ